MSGVSPASISKAAAQTAAQSGTATGARLLVSALEDAGATTVFGYPGGAIMPAL